MFTLTIIALSVCHSNYNGGMYLNGGGPSEYVCQGKQTIDLPTLEACRQALKGTDLFGTKQYESVDVVITSDKIAYCATKPPEPKPLGQLGIATPPNMNFSITQPN